MDHIKSYISKNSKQQGDVGLGAAIAFYTSIGYTVSIPLNDSQQYDLIVDDGKKINRVQVKTTKNKKPSGNYEVGLRTCGGNQSFHTVKKFDHKSVEILFVLCEDGSSYSIPTESFSCKSSIDLGKKYEKFKATYSLAR